MVRPVPSSGGRSTITEAIRHRSESRSTRGLRPISRPRPSRPALLSYELQNTQMTDELVRDRLSTANSVCRVVTQRAAKGVTIPPQRETLVFSGRMGPVREVRSGCPHVAWAARSLQAWRILAPSPMTSRPSSTLDGARRLRGFMSAADTRLIEAKPPSTATAVPAGGRSCPVTSTSAFHCDSWTVWWEASYGSMARVNRRYRPRSAAKSDLDSTRGDQRRSIRMIWRPKNRPRRDPAPYDAMGSPITPTSPVRRRRKSALGRGGRVSPRSNCPGVAPA
jgi:hypothetical protein